MQLFVNSTSAGCPGDCSCSTRSETAEIERVKLRREGRAVSRKTPPYHTAIVERRCECRLSNGMIYDYFRAGIVLETHRVSELTAGECRADLLGRIMNYDIWVVNRSKAYYWPSWRPCVRSELHKMPINSRGRGEAKKDVLREFRSKLPW